MGLPRCQMFSTTFRAQACRSVRRRAAGQSWRQIGRRFYASGHHEGSKKASSDLPWIIGSVGITVPAATWLWQQGPKKSDHHDDHGHEDHEEHGENEEESGHNENQEPQDSEAAKESSDEEEGGDDGGDEVSKQGLDDSRHETSQQIKTVDPDADEGKKDGPDEDTDKGHEGEQKGTRVTEGDEKRKSESPVSNSLNSYMADERQSKKSDGLVETAKITGTVKK